MSEQLPGGTEQRQLFEWSAVEAEGGVVPLGRDYWTTRCANGAEVEGALPTFSHGGHLPGFERDTRWRLAWGGGAEVAVAFYRGFEVEFALRTALYVLLLVWIRFPHVLEGGSV